MVNQKRIVMKTLKLIIISFLTVFALALAFSCEEDPIIDEGVTINMVNDVSFEDSLTSTEATLRGGAVKVDVCHNGHIINVSVNSLPAHLAHSDAVDMDGDGYFDKDNVCGPTDCDDANEEYGWCEYLNLWDFDEPCEGDDYYYGDYYCSGTYSWDYGDDSCPYSGSYSFARLVDNDSSNDCDTNDENDYGEILAECITYTYCGEDYFEGGICYYLEDYDLGEQVVYFCEYVNTKEAYDDAFIFLAAINELAAELGQVNRCEDYFILGNNTTSRVKADDATQSLPHESIGQLPTEIQEVMDRIKARQSK